MAAYVVLYLRLWASYKHKTRMGRIEYKLILAALRDSEVQLCTLYVCTAVLQCSTFVLKEGKTLTRRTGRLGTILSFVPRLLNSNCTRRFSEVVSSRLCDYFASLGSYLLTTGGNATSTAICQEWKQT